MYILRKLFPRWYWRRRLSRYRNRPHTTTQQLRIADFWERVERSEGVRHGK